MNFYSIYLIDFLLNFEVELRILQNFRIFKISEAQISLVATILKKGLFTKNSRKGAPNVPGPWFIYHKLLKVCENVWSLHAFFIRNLGLG